MNNASFVPRFLATLAVLIVAGKLWMEPKEHPATA